MSGVEYSDGIIRQSSEPVPAEQGGSHAEPSGEEFNVWAIKLRDLPAAPEDPWDATWQQEQSAERRLHVAIRDRQRATVRVADVRLVLHAKGIAEMSGEVCGEVRAASKRVAGGNCAFADDDLAILEHLARRACDAGLTDKLAPDVRKKADALAAGRLAEPLSEAAQVVAKSSG